MTKEDAHLYLPLVQALVDGKTIQIEVGSEWEDINDPSFTRPPKDYRIKPEHRRWKVWVDSHGFIQGTVAEIVKQIPTGWTQIEVTETLPENNQ